MENKKHISVRVSEEIHTKLKMKSVTEKKSLQEILTKLINLYLAGEVDLCTKKEESQ